MRFGCRIVAPARPGLPKGGRGSTSTKRARTPDLVDDRDFLVRFWGVRGSIATPGAGTARYGGNTACVEVCCGDRLLILDAGTGIRGLGAEIRRAAAPSGPPFAADLFLSHTHLDHVCGLPFFQPAHDTGGGDGGTGPRARVWAGHLAPERGQSIRDVLNQLTIDPLFPVPIESLGVELACEDFAAGDTLDPGGGISVATAPLNHPAAPPATASPGAGAASATSPIPNMCRRGPTKQSWR